MSRTWHILIIATNCLALIGFTVGWILDDTQQYVKACFSLLMAIQFRMMARDEQRGLDAKS